MPSHRQIDVDDAPNAVADVAGSSSGFVDRLPSPWRRALRKILLGIITQYVIIAATVGLSLAATLHYYVTPQIIANFEAIAKALKR